MGVHQLADADLSIPPPYRVMDKHTRGMGCEIELDASATGSCGRFNKEAGGSGGFVVAFIEKQSSSAKGMEASMNVGRSKETLPRSACKRKKGLGVELSSQLLPLLRPTLIMSECDWTFDPSYSSEVWRKVQRDKHCEELEGKVTSMAGEPIIPD
ncbi:uncharacterized protein UTRI_05626 [Ustilago trichophora]|uniref:Uncharacterized protein n=1 Tax=Ustilago trichophora TaxID=86804 RepID=A0A5C3EF57_9BASI|nr:uncharacterized protein UTRI_05626 [Ustilago trichophora]